MQFTIYCDTCDTSISLSDVKSQMNFWRSLYSLKQELSSEAKLKSRFLSLLNAWHLIIKWYSSSVSPLLQFKHTLSFGGTYWFLPLNRPVSIRRRWELVRSLATARLASKFARFRYGSGVMLHLKILYVLILLPPSWPLLALSLWRSVRQYLS